jgi:hypothetical protein
MHGLFGSKKNNRSISKYGHHRPQYPPHQHLTPL